MNVFHGISASGGIAKGKAFVLSVYVRDEIKKNPVKKDGIDADWQRFEAARVQALEHFQSLIDRTDTRQAAIFQTYVLMLSDPEFLAELKKEHAQLGVCAEWVVDRKSREYAEMLRVSGDSYLIERAEDILDVYGKVIDILLDTVPFSFNSIPERAVLAARFLSPSEAVLLSKRNLSAVLLDKGAANSHLAILARAYGIPMIFALKDIEKCVSTGDEVIVDGEGGCVFVCPDAETSAEYEHKIAAEMQRRNVLASFSDRPAQTKDGLKVDLYANIGSAEEAPEAAEQGACGIGLFRTEFLFMGTGFTDEQCQYEAYRAVLETMKDKPVVIRTLDAGGDKAVDIPGAALAAEKNPLLGCRAIRLCLEKPDIFKTQLRALLRASVHGNLKIMLPLISDIGQIRRTKELLEQAKTALRAERIPFKEDVPLGIMVETPAAAITADELAKEAAFFSIGSNDLTQYTLCIDRENGLTAALFDELHPAVRRLILRSAQAAFDRHIPISVCGEMAGDPAGLLTLMAAGITSFSVSPKKISVLKECLSRFSSADIGKLKKWTDSPIDSGVLREKLHAFLNGAPL